MAQAREDARMMGVLLVAPEPEDYAVWPACADSVEVFLAMNTQWQRAAWSGEAIGLDYTAMASVMDFLAIPDRRMAFDDVRVMEHEALRIWRARAK